MRVVYARPRQPGVIAARHRPRVSAVADVPDAKHRLVVRQHRRRRMRVIVTRLRRTARDDDLAFRVVGEVDVLQSLAVLLP
jgi:DNA repair ATPase RecN